MLETTIDLLTHFYKTFIVFFLYLALQIMALKKMHGIRFYFALVPVPFMLAGVIWSIFLIIEAPWLLSSISVPSLMALLYIAVIWLSYFAIRKPET